VRRAFLPVLLAAAALVAGCRGTYEVAYDDFVEARQHDAVDRGWVPEWLPESTTAIREVHDADTGERVLTATLAEPAAFDEACPDAALDPPPIPYPRWLEARPDPAGARDCGDDGVAVLDGDRLILWRGVEPHEDPTT
jgi:hypothetical protein